MCRVRRAAPIPPPLYAAPVLSHPYMSLATAASHPAAASLYPSFASPLLALPPVATSNPAALYQTPQPLGHSHAAHSYSASSIPTLSSNRMSANGGSHTTLLAAGSSSHQSHPIASVAAIGGSLGLAMPVHTFVAPGHQSAAGASSVGGMSSSLYAYGLPSALTDGDLHELFGLYGGVSSVHIMRNDNGTPKGYAFINMKSVHEAGRRSALPRPPPHLRQDAQSQLQATAAQQPTQRNKHRQPQRAANTASAAAAATDGLDMATAASASLQSAPSTEARAGESSDSGQPG